MRRESADIPEYDLDRDKAGVCDEVEREKGWGEPEARTDEAGY
ncbi:MAG: hypothetical protein OEV08_03210 [Nitrospira sp.]|nr:hypothetical protein [Nitrospira sp.]